MRQKAALIPLFIAAAIVTGPGLTGEEAAADNVMEITTLTDSSPETEWKAEPEESQVDCRYLVDSYIEWDNRPELMDTTAYCYGEITYSGNPVREGIAAAKIDWVGKCAILYEAVETNNGYEMGNMIGIYEITDTGYGKTSGDGIQSEVRADKDSRGTIERGECIDIYRENLERCEDWMRQTKGKVYVHIISGNG